MQMRARLSNDHGWRQNRHDHHKGRARILTSGRVSIQPAGGGGPTDLILQGSTAAGVSINR
jgi:hypothetical protein